jgi:hypothetical protein
MSYGQILTQCVGSPLPAGWGWYSSSTDFVTCKPAIPNNVIHIIDLRAAPAGARNTVCSGIRLPVGWIVTGYSTDFVRCGNSNVNNVSEIQYTG